MQEIKVEAPRGSRVLVVTPPVGYQINEYEGTTLLRRLEEQFEAARKNDAYPVIVVLVDGWSVRWLEAD